MTQRQLFDKLKMMQKSELVSKLVELRKAQMHLRFRKKTSELIDTSQFKKVRKDIAQVKTLLCEKVK